MNLMAALGQVVDYVFKAAKAYAATPEGEKELADIINALENSDGNTGASESKNQPVSVQVGRYRNQ